MKFIYRFLFLTLFFLPIVSCVNNPESIASDHYNRGDLISHHEKGTLTKLEVIERVTELKANDFAKYDVSYEHITYSTIYMGKVIDSDGLLLLPKGAPQTRLLMYCHGTELPSAYLNVDKITPSMFNGEQDDFRDVRNMGLSWATAGYTVFIPDYIGFGATIAEEHPYVCFQEMFESNIDGLLAVKELLLNKDIGFDNHLFLTGWSQGAGASLSAHKYIQEKYSDQFTVMASSSLSGPYNFVRFAESFLERKNEEITAMPIFSWGLYSLNKFTSLRRPTDQLYAYPVFSQFSSILVPSKKPAKVFNAYFLKKWEDGSDSAFKNVLIANSFHEGWKPVGKVFLHHGDVDDLVPSYNTEDAYNGLRASGGDVKKYIYPGGKHDTDLGNYILNTLTDFNQIQ